MTDWRRFGELEQGARRVPASAALQAPGALSEYQAGRGSALPEFVEVEMNNGTIYRHVGGKFNDRYTGNDSTGRTLSHEDAKALVDVGVYQLDAVRWDEYDVLETYRKGTHKVITVTNIAGHVGTFSADFWHGLTYAEQCLEAVSISAPVAVAPRPYSNPAMYKPWPPEFTASVKFLRWLQAVCQPRTVHPAVSAWGKQQRFSPSFLRSLFIKDMPHREWGLVGWTRVITLPSAPDTDGASMRADENDGRTLYRKPHDASQDWRF